MSDTLNIFTDLLGQVDKLPLAVVLALVIIAIGLALERSRFPNQYIPLVSLTLGAVAYAFLGDASKISPTQPHPRAILTFYGVLIGFVSWGARKFVLKRLEKYLPEGFFPPEEFAPQPPMPPPAASGAAQTSALSAEEQQQQKPDEQKE